MDIRERLDAAGISSDAYSLAGPREDRYCLEHRGDQWTVYFSERGEQRDARTFRDAIAAQDELMRRLKADPTTRALWKDPLVVTVMEWQVDLMAMFGGTSEPLLGREDFFAEFEVTIDQRSRRFSL